MNISEIRPGGCRDLLPRILRARDYHLYDAKNRRYLDLFQAGGTAFLGNRPEGLSNEVKNVLARGLWAEYPSVYGRRLQRLLAELIPSHPESVIFPGCEQALALVRELSGGVNPSDPALEAIPPEGAALWRPFSKGSWERARLLMPVLPFPGRFGPAVLCFRSGEVPEFSSVPEESSPVLLAGTVRAAALLVRRMKEGEDFRWKRFDDVGWPRQGPYLKYPGRLENYRAFFTRALALGMLVPPDAFSPLILPGLMSPGEETSLHGFLLREPEQG